MPHQDHAKRIAAWMARSAADSGSTPQLVRRFEHTLEALWGRARRTLGEVTLGAILGRVFHDASEKFPSAPRLTVGPDGIDWRELHQGAPALSIADASELIGFVLTEFLTVLGNLTAEILTP